MFLYWKGKESMLKDNHWLSMYSNVYTVRLWRTGWFCFYAFSFLYSSLLLSFTQTQTFFIFVLLLLILLFCWARGLCILSKCAVCTFVLLRVSFCFVLLIHRTCWVILRDTNTGTKSKKKWSREGNDTEGYTWATIAGYQNRQQISTVFNEKHIYQPSDHYQSD